MRLQARRSAGVELGAASIASMMYWSPDRVGAGRSEESFVMVSSPLMDAKKSRTEVSHVVGRNGCWDCGWRKSGRETPACS